MSSTHEATFDPTDPHGFHAHDTHGHVILSLRTLLGVLVALMVFTVLTVFASRFEVWIAEAFHVEIPQIVNVAIAMSIAVVKALLVALFFMQLRYDAPLNSMIFAFCILTFGVFLSFTAIDLFGRDAIDPTKQGELVAGGVGNVTRYERVFNEKSGTWERKRITIPSGTAVTAHAKNRSRPGEHHDSHADDHAPLSTASRSIPMTGLMLFAPKDAHAGDTHADPGIGDPAQNDPGHADPGSGDSGGTPPPAGDGGH